MSKLLNNNFFLIKEHIGLLKAANNYDIYNPETSEMVMICREMQLGVLTKIFRFTKYKIMTPFHVEVMSTREEPIFSVKRGVSIFGFSPVTVFDQNGLEIGQLQRKFRLGGAKIDITDMMNNRLFTLKGNLIGWEFKITNEDVELATISKKWEDWVRNSLRQPTIMCYQLINKWKRTRLRGALFLDQYCVWISF